MSWWYKEVKEDGRPALIGPFDSSSTAQSDLDQREIDYPERTYDTPYEADEGEPERFPRPVANTLSGGVYVEKWDDGNSYPIT